MLEFALKAARRSTIKRHHTGAAIFDRSGKLISIGWSHRTHVNLSTTPYSMHAESHAIFRAIQTGQAHRLKGATIAVATICASTNRRPIVDAKPCTPCGVFIKSAGITDVIYTRKERVK